MVLTSGACAPRTALPNFSRTGKSILGKTSGSLRAFRCRSAPALPSRAIIRRHAPVAVASRVSAIEEPNTPPQAVHGLARAVVDAVRAVGSAVVAVPGGASTAKLFTKMGCRVVMIAGVSMTNTLPLITSAIASFIKLYLLLLFTRVLLTWFPNVNWMGQPWVTLRQVTDPYLNLFRNLIPPIMGQIDMTPIFGFLVLQFAAQLLGTDDII
mmetsp:Transcript_11952/g.22816  ORF Transcript_11952/g.22816 Transcript_11952/m.22816 type:complete len:211 (+) Transcript_11952:60-692(+)